MDPKTYARLLGKSPTRIRLMESENKEIEEGDKVKFEMDGETKSGTVVELHDDEARVKTADDEVHTCKRADLEKAGSINEGAGPTHTVFMKEPHDSTKYIASKHNSHAEAKAAIQKHQAEDEKNGDTGRKYSVFSHPE